MNPLATRTAAPDRPLAIGLLLGVSGWAAGLFVLFFVVLLFHPDSAGQAAISGAILVRTYTVRLLGRSACRKSV